MPSIESQIQKLDLKNYSINQLDTLIEQPKLHVGFFGKRNLFFDQATCSLKNPYPVKRTTLNDLANIVQDKLYNYPIPQIPSYKETGFFSRFDSTSRNELNNYKNTMEQSKVVLQKIAGIHNSSKEEIKKYNIITRIFFHIRNFFNFSFSYNLAKAAFYIKYHEGLIEEREKALKPFSRYHKINVLFSVSTGLMTATNIILQMFGINNVPYLSKTLNVASCYTFFQVATSHFTNAMSKI